MELNSFQKNNVKTLAKVLQKRRKEKKILISEEYWYRYLERIKQRLNDVRENAERNRNLSLQEMFNNFLDLIGSLDELKTNAEYKDE